jgi:RNA polymerase sigma factor for flagellar operon FliA
LADVWGKTMDPPEVLERVRDGLALVDRVAKGFACALGSSVEIEDWVGYGRMGLLAAARAFDPNRGPSFEGYATIRVRGAIWDAARAEAASRVRGSTADTSTAETGVARSRGLRNLCELLAETSTLATFGVLDSTRQEGALGVAGSDPERDLSNAQLVALVARWVRDLPHGEAELVWRHYFEDESLDRIGQDLGISKSWASRLHHRALKRLSRQARRASLAPRAA